MIVTISKSLATICFLGQCHPALVGEATPLGEYTLNKRVVLSEGYGGDVLQFKYENGIVFAIHRPFSIYGSSVRQRALTENTNRVMTKGCVNVSDAVYQILYKNSTKVTVKIVM